MWTDDRKKYFCPDCQKSFTVNSDEVRFAPDLVKAIASQVVGEITPMIEKALKSKQAASTVPKSVKPAADSIEPDEEKHKWD